MRPSSESGGARSRPAWFTRIHPTHQPLDFQSAALLLVRLTEVHDDRPKLVIVIGRRERSKIRTSSAAAAKVIRAATSICTTVAAATLMSRIETSHPLPRKSAAVRPLVA